MRTQGAGVGLSRGQEGCSDSSAGGGAAYLLLQQKGGCCQRAHAMRLHKASYRTAAAGLPVAAASLPPLPLPRRAIRSLVD